MKNILYVVTSAETAGGVMSIISKKINYLVKNGYNVTLLSMTKCDKPFYNISDNVPILCASSNEDYKVSIKDFLRAVRIVRDKKFDIVISVDAQYVTWVLPFIAKGNNILEIHQSYDGLVDFYNRGRFATMNVIFHKIMQRVAFSHYKKVIVLTEEDKRKWKLKKVLTIPNFHCINVSCLPKQNVTSKKIVCVGRFHFQKGFDLLIQVWKIVALNFPDWELHYYGANLTPEVRSEMNRLQAPDSFVLKGYERNLSTIFSDAYLNIVPSRCESFSLTTIESMCYGVPTISFDTTGPKSIIEDGVDGFLIKQFDIEKLAETLNMLIADKKLREVLSANCFRKSILYDESSVMKQWVSLFNEM